MYSGVKERIDDLRVFMATGEMTDALSTLLTGEACQTHRWERLGKSSSGWLSPLEIDERMDPAGPDKEDSGRRCSKKGFFRFSLSKYLGILDWVGRGIRGDKAGSIPIQLKSIFQRLGITSHDELIDSINEFGALGEEWFVRTERCGRPDLTFT